MHGRGEIDEAGWDLLLDDEEENGDSHINGGTTNGHLFVDARKPTPDDAKDATTNHHQEQGTPQKKTYATADDSRLQRRNAEVGRPRPFKLERWFARYEFGVDHLLCSSDCRTMSVASLLAMHPEPSAATRDLLALPLGYTEPLGNPVLKQEVAKLYSSIAPEEVFVCAGAEEAVFLFFRAILDENDAVVVHYPCYQSLLELPRSIGCQVIKWVAKEEDGWELDVDLLEQLLESRASAGQPRVNAIVVNCPHNPTGYSMTRGKLNRLVELAKKHDTFLFSDEVYRFLDYPEEVARSEDDQECRILPPVCDLYEKGVSLGVMSKSFGLAGLRIGWVATRSRAAVIQRMAELKDYTSICCSGPSEYLAVVALRIKEKILKRNRELVARNMVLLDEFFAKHSEEVRWVRPKAGPVAFPRLVSAEHSTSGESIVEFCEALVREQGVLLLPGTCYAEEDQGGKGREGTEFGTSFRLGFGREDLPAALAKFGAFLASRRSAAS